MTGPRILSERCGLGWRVGHGLGDQDRPQRTGDWCRPASNGVSDLRRKRRSGATALIEAPFWGATGHFSGECQRPYSRETFLPDSSSIWRARTTASHLNFGSTQGAYSADQPVPKRAIRGARPRVKRPRQDHRIDPSGGARESRVAPDPVLSGTPTLPGSRDRRPHRLSWRSPFLQYAVADHRHAIYQNMDHSIRW